MTTATQLALLGGRPAVTVPAPRSWPLYARSTVQNVARLIERGQTFDYKHGAEIAGFESDFARYHGQFRALFVNSGTSALLSAYFGLGIARGDEVICPDLTFASSATPLLLLGAVPRLVDVDPRTGNIDPSNIESQISNRTKAVVVTHLWGHPCDMTAIAAICRRRRLLLVEDCSHAHGSTYRDRLVGTFGDAAAFSLGTKKMISAGMGGVLLTRKQQVFERACLLGHFQHRSKLSVADRRLHEYCHSGLGANLRGTPIQALLASSHLKTLDARIATRAHNLERLRQGLVGVKGIRPPYVARNVTMGAWYGFKLQYVPDELSGLPRAVFIKAMQAEGVALTDYEYPPLHTLPALNRWIGTRRTFPVSTAIATTGITVPAHLLHRKCTNLIDQYVKAFRKVSELHERLL